MGEIGNKVIICSNRSGIKKYRGQIGTLIDIQEKNWSNSGGLYYIVQIDNKTIRLLSEKEMEFVKNTNNKTINNKYIESKEEVYIKHLNCYYEKFKQFDGDTKLETINTLMDVYRSTDGIVQMLIGKVIVDLQMLF